METSDSIEKSIDDIRKRIRLLNWDLSMISNEELKKAKVAELKNLDLKLKLLLSGGEADGTKERKERKEVII